MFEIKETPKIAAPVKFWLSRRERRKAERQAKK